jgi:hypothetical protein
MCLEATDSDNPSVHRATLDPRMAPAQLEKLLAEASDKRERFTPGRSFYADF